jgi:hypothetical protein
MFEALGHGVHFGEWWGNGIQRGYELKEKRFSLFNTHRWTKETTPEGLYVVPVLYQGPFSQNCIEGVLMDLTYGSVASGNGFEAEGIIIGGRRLGRTIGFPTVNIAWEPELKPSFGVYAVEVIFKGEAMPAVANYGLRPTVESGPVAPLLEAHVLRGTAPTTGDAVRVRWVRRLRAEQKFADLAALQAQIAKDSAQAKQALGLLG